MAGQGSSGKTRKRVRNRKESVPSLPFSRCKPVELGSCCTWSREGLGLHNPLECVYKCSPAPLHVPCQQSRLCLPRDPSVCSALKENKRGLAELRRSHLKRKSNCSPESSSAVSRDDVEAASSAPARGNHAWLAETFHCCVPKSGLSGVIRSPSAKTSFPQVQHHLCFHRHRTKGAAMRCDAISRLPASVGSSTMSTLVSLLLFKMCLPAASQRTLLSCGLAAR